MDIIATQIGRWDRAGFINSDGSKTLFTTDPSFTGDGNDFAFDDVQYSKTNFLFFIFYLFWGTTYIPRRHEHSICQTGIRPQSGLLASRISTDPMAGSGSGDVPGPTSPVEKCRKTHVPRDDLPRATAPVQS